MSTSKIDKCNEWQDSLGFLAQVPSVGVLTNGTSYLFYKCHHDSQPRLLCSEFMGVELHKGIEAKRASKAVLNILRTMLQVFLDQKRAIENFWKKQTSCEGALAC